MGPIFPAKVPNYGSDFQNFPGFAIRAPENVEKIAMGTFCGKIPKHGYFFGPNYP